MKLVFALLILLSYRTQRVAYGSYTACGDLDEDDTSSKLAENINSHVQRLLNKRKVNYRWQNTPEVILGIQLGSPNPVLPLNETATTLINEIKRDISTMTTGKQALYALASKSLCVTNLQTGNISIGSSLRNSIESEFRHSQGNFFYPNSSRMHMILKIYLDRLALRKTPQNGWYGLALGIGALCVTERKSVGNFYVRRLLHAQNSDGSFGRSHGLDMTAQALLSLTCLKKIKVLQHHLHQRVYLATERAAAYLRSMVVTERANIWIGDEYASPASVLAIMEWNKWNEDRWRCRLIMDSLNKAYDPSEEESAIAQRLQAFGGKTYMSLLSDEYTCEEPDTLPEELPQKVIVPELTVPGGDICTQNGKGKGFYFYFTQTKIDVFISVYINYFHVNENASPDTSIVIRNVDKDKTLTDILSTAQCRGLLTYETTQSSWGSYVTSLEGVRASDEDHEYWSIEVNGRSLAVGIDQYKPSHSDNIVFILKKW